MTVEVFWGDEPSTRSEVQFLDQLKADLTSRSTSAIILANFFTQRASRQIDFLVVTANHVSHVELKNFTEPLVGHTNGPWSVRQPDGSLEVIDRQNPYTQAQECKLALSDDMHTLAAQDRSIPSPPQGRKFYTQIDSVVCIFPRLADGSQVPNDFKIKTLGYADFLRFLTTPGAHPQWSRQHWSTFIRMLTLADATTDGHEVAVNTAQREVSDYSRRFKDFYHSRLHELVPLPIRAGANIMSSLQLVDLLQEARHIQIIGPSGCGKSHLAKHAAITIQASSFFAVIIEAGMYEDRLLTLLNRSIGRFSNKTAEELLRAAAINGQTVLLIVDGFNECATPLQERLLGDISSFCLRTNAQTLITSQKKVALPENLSDVLINTGELGEEDRRAILHSYGATEIIQICEPFSTAYELSIASECATELTASTPANLFDAFIRKRLSKNSSPAHTRATLRQLALVMDERLTTWLSVDDVWRITEQLLTKQSAPVDVLDEVLNCSLIITQQGKFSFSHELLGRFLAAEALLLQHRALPELVRELKKPRHEDLTAFVVTLERNAAHTEQLLLGLAEPSLFADALRGNFGTVATHVARSSSLGLLSIITNGMETTTFTIRSAYEVDVAGGHEISAAEHALLAAVGAVMLEGLFVQEVVALLDATDEACRRSADIQATLGKRPDVSAIVSAVQTGLGGANTSIAAKILQEASERAHIDLGFRHNKGAAKISAKEVATLIAGANRYSHGRLLLACSMLGSTINMEAAALIPEFLKLSWKSNAYHVQLKGLMTTQRFASVVDGDPLHDEIVIALNSIDTTKIDIMRSTIVVDAMDAYGMLKSPVDAGQVKSDIKEIFQSAPTDEQRKRAYEIVTAQFEEIVSEAHRAAIDELDHKKRTELYTIAALSTPPDGFWNAWLLRQLINAEDRRTLPAFEVWATRLDVEAPYIQGVGSCYALAMEGSAQFMESPPQLKIRKSQDTEAWQHFGAIIFWLHRTEISEDEIIAHCTPLWRQLITDLTPAASDALYWLTQPEMAVLSDGKLILPQLIDKFREELRTILEWSLVNRQSLTSLFENRGCGSLIPRPGGISDYIINKLGDTGNACTVELLRTYADDPVLGSTAINSIRKLTGRQD